MSSTLSNVLEPGAEPIPGYRLRQYRGRGGFAVVWEADDPDGRRVALKFISTERMGADLTTAREIRSVQAIRQLYHRGLLPIYGIWSINRAIVIAMELADGSLMDLLDAYQQEFRTAIPPEFLAAYTEQAAEALDYLNARRHVLDGKRVGIQHGDVKPNNILLVGERVKLADFGLVAMLSSFFSTNYPSGTVAYAAPEVFQGALSEWTDQYS
ncbi:MAG TPA: protein kinase, partial [Gemmataceae bacterium]